MYLCIALGDSITAGSGATSPAFSYPCRLTAQLQYREKTAVGEVLAEPGWTSADLTAAVLENGPASLASANAISVWIGGDDVAFTGLALLEGAPMRTVATSIRRYAGNLNLLLANLRRSSKARVIVCTQYNPFPNSPLAVNAIDALNAITTSIAPRHGAVLAPAHEWFAGRQAELIAGYKTGRLEDVLGGHNLPVHPNNRGHRVIAEGLLPLLP